MVDSCWRVCKASRLAPSSLESASVRLSAPVCSVLIIALVKSWRICTVDRLEPNDCACERSVVSAAVRSVEAAVMSAAAAQLLAAALIARPAEVKSTPVDGDRRGAGFVQRDRQVCCRVEQVDAVEARVGRELVDLGPDGAELGGEARADRGVGGLLRLADRAPGRTARAW